MNTGLLKERLGVLRFPADYFSWANIAMMSDDEKRQLAEDNEILTNIFDSLDEFQVAVNGDEVDVSQSFIFFVPNKFEKPSEEYLDTCMNKIKENYHKGEVCMAEHLATEPADGLSLEQAFHLYIRAMNYADGDRFFIQRPAHEIKEI